MGSETGAKVNVAVAGWDAGMAVADGSSDREEERDGERDERPHASGVATRVRVGSPESGAGRPQRARCSSGNMGVSFGQDPSLARMPCHAGLPGARNPRRGVAGAAPERTVVRRW